MMISVDCSLRMAMTMIKMIVTIIVMSCQGGWFVLKRPEYMADQRSYNFLVGISFLVGCSVLSILFFARYRVQIFASTNWCKKICPGSSLHFSLHSSWLCGLNAAN